MRFLRKSARLLAAAVTFVLFIWTGRPSYAGSDQRWEVVKAFAKAIKYQESHYLPYLAAVGILIFIALLLIILYYFRTKGKTGSLFKISVSNQKRALFRLSIDLDLYFAPAGTQNFRAGKVVDLSGGGLQFSTDQQLRINNLLKIIFQLSPENKFELTGRIARVAEKPGESEKKYLVGVEFLDITTSDQDKIIGFLLQEQQVRI